MKVTDLRAVQPATRGSPPDWRTQLGQIVVEVRTDAGLTGIGVGGGGAAGIHVVQTVLRDLLVGRDADDVEGLHAAMCEHTVFYGRKGLAVMAVSGADLALWDLRGRAAGRPVAKLLNPSCDLERPLPAYTTVFDEAGLATALSAGHQAVKLHVDRMVGTSEPARVAELVAGARRRLGPDRQIMIDAFGRWDADTTLRVAEAVAPYDVAWLEEPLPPDDLAGYEVVAAGSPVPIAGGEHEYLAEGFRELIDRRCCAILQPDVSWCGGMTALVEVYRMAAAAGVRVCPHRGCEPFALAALAALDEEPLAESPRSWFDCLEGAPAVADGAIRASAAPGFGVGLAPSLRAG